MITVFSSTTLAKSGSVPTKNTPYGVLRGTVSGVLVYTNYRECAVETRIGQRVKKVIAMVNVKEYLTGDSRGMDGDVKLNANYAGYYWNGTGSKALSGFSTHEVRHTQSYVVYGSVTNF